MADTAFNLEAPRLKCGDLVVGASQHRYHYTVMSDETEAGLVDVACGNDVYTGVPADLFVRVTNYPKLRSVS